MISGYAAGYAVFLVTGGRLGDLYGRKRLFILAMAGLTAFTWFRVVGTVMMSRPRAYSSGG